MPCHHSHTKFMCQYLPSQDVVQNYKIFFTLKSLKCVMLTLEIHNLSFCFIIPISNGHNFMVSGATLIVLKYDGVVLKCDSLERLAVLHKQCC